MENVMAAMLMVWEVWMCGCGRGVRVLEWNQSCGERVYVLKSATVFLFLHVEVHEAPCQQFLRVSDVVAGRDCMWQQQGKT